MWHIQAIFSQLLVSSVCKFQCLVLQFYSASFLSTLLICSFVLQKQHYWCWFDPYPTMWMCKHVHIKLACTAGYALTRTLPCFSPSNWIIRVFFQEAGDSGFRFPLYREGLIIHPSDFPAQCSNQHVMSPSSPSTSFESDHLGRAREGNTEAQVKEKQIKGWVV